MSAMGSTGMASTGRPLTSAGAMSTGGMTSATAGALSSVSLLDSMALHQSLRLTKYAQARPARVFMPAYRSLLGEQKKIEAGTRRRKKTPWSISPWYQEFSPYQALIEQKKAAQKQSLVGKTKLRRRRRQTE